MLQGLRAALGAGAVAHVDGCADAPCASADIGAATALSNAASATVLVLGNYFGKGGPDHGWPLCKGGTEDGCESEAHDRTTIELPVSQNG
eukprot:SAG25_NODE_47_length_18954_cov_11.266295_20_plen_90_part_00